MAERGGRTKCGCGRAIKARGMSKCFECRAAAAVPLKERLAAIREEEIRISASLRDLGLSGPTAARRTAHNIWLPRQGGQWHWRKIHPITGKRVTRSTGVRDRRMAEAVALQFEIDLARESAVALTDGQTNYDLPRLLKLREGITDEMRRIDSELSGLRFVELPRLVLEMKELVDAGEAGPRLRALVNEFRRKYGEVG